MIQLCLFLLLILIQCTGTVDTTLWELLYTDVGYLAIKNNNVWRTQISATGPGGFGVQKLDIPTEAWTTHPGKCVTIALDPTDLYCIQDNFSGVHTSDQGNSWPSMGISANDAKVNTDGQVWAVTRTAATDGFTVIQYFDPYQASNILIAGIGAVKIGAANDGFSWAVTSSGSIKKYDGNNWNNMAGQATDIILGSDNIPVILTKTSTNGGFGVQKWNPSGGSWADVPGIGGYSLALDQYNNIYCD